MAADLTTAARANIETAASRILAYVEEGSERTCARAAQILVDLWFVLDQWEQWASDEDRIQVELSGVDQATVTAIRIARAKLAELGA